MQALIGLKKEQSQRFLENGKRIPVTLIDVKGNTIVALKTQEKDKYQAVQLGFSMKKHASRAELGHAKGAKLEKAPKFLKEVKISDDLTNLPEIGSILNPMDVFEPGDMVDVSGFSKGKGFQGGVKRWGFHGGPKTHGQSDRHRAPGSIGQGTTPGRVYKGKRMAGNMGNENVTIKNLEVIEITNDGVLTIKGLVPGIINGPLIIIKTGTDKNFVPLYSDKKDEKPAVQAEESTDAKEEDQEAAKKAEIKDETNNAEQSSSGKASEEKGEIEAETAKQNIDEWIDGDKEKSAESKETEVNKNKEDEIEAEVKVGNQEKDENKEEIKEKGDATDAK